MYARLPKVHRDETRTQDLDRLELIRFLQVCIVATTEESISGRSPGPRMYSSTWARWT